MRILQAMTVFIAAATLAFAIIPFTPTSTPAPTPVVSTPRSNPSRILSASDAYTKSGFDDQMEHDRPIFLRRFSLHGRLFVIDNLVNICVLAGDSLKFAFQVLKDEIQSCLDTMDAANVVNIVFRATVRGLTPGYMLLDEPSIEWILDDITATELAEDRLLDELNDTIQSSLAFDTASVDSLSTPATLIPTLSDFRFWLKYLIVNLDFSAVATLTARAAMSQLDPDGTLDTYGVMEIFDNLLDVLGCVSRKPHRSVGEIMLSLDAAFPSLGLSPLLVDIPLRSHLDLQSLLALPPPEKSSGYARPLAPSQDYKTPPISFIDSLAQELVGYAHPPTPS